MALRYIISNIGLKSNIINHCRYISCWSCGTNDTNNLVVNLFCSKCNALQQPTTNVSYFKIMGVSETYDLDETELAKKFKELQKYLHPDKFANKPKQEQEISEKYSSLVNEAYKTLLEPLARGKTQKSILKKVNKKKDVENSLKTHDVKPNVGIYMLKLKGKEIPENTEVDQGFLMMIMEKNEEVESADSEEEIMKLNNENKTVIKDLQKKLSKAFFDGDLKTVTKLLSIMKYYTSIDNQIQSVIRNKGIIR